MCNWLPWIVGVAAVAVVVYAFSKYANDRLSPPDTADASGMVGNAAPDFEGDFAVNGQVTKLSDLRGKVVLVDFWAVWCKPCIMTFPHLRAWQQKYSKDGFEIVGLTEPIEPAKLKDFAVQHNLTHLLMSMSDSHFSQTCRAYQVGPIPHVTLVDRQGIIRMVRIGAGEENAVALESEIKKLLAQR